MGKIFDSVNGLIMEAMKAKESARANAYKNMKAKMLEFKTAKNAKLLDDAAEVTLIKKMVIELKNDANIFNMGGREDLAIPALEEAGYLETFLPAEATEADIRKVIDAQVDADAGISQKEMGMLIKSVKGALPNADGKLVSEIVRTYIKK